MSLKWQKRDWIFCCRILLPAKNFVWDFMVGEPLLEFELIKKCVEYMETQTKDKAIHYQITTNGTLLKGEILT